MPVRLGLVLLIMFCCSKAVAQDRSTNHPCDEAKVTAAIAKYFEKPAALAHVVSQNQLILALVAPWPVTAENHKVTILGQRSLAGTDFSCLVQYEKTLSYKDVDMVLNLNIKSTFDLTRYGPGFTITEREQLDSSVNATKGNGEPLNAMGLDKKQEQALLDKFKPMSPEGRAKFQEHPLGTARENAAILRSPFPGQPAPAAPISPSMPAPPSPPVASPGPPPTLGDMPSRWRQTHDNSPAPSPALPTLSTTNASSLPKQADSLAYAQGSTDWKALKGWLDVQRSVSMGRAAGAEYWAANRNVGGHATCAQAAEDYDVLQRVERSTFLAGCNDAKDRLDVMDARRRTEPQYRAGFNEEARRSPMPVAALPGH